jgi:RNase P subunit RPR2
MGDDENLEARIKLLEELAQKGITLDIKICPQCKAAGLRMMDVIGLYSPLSPVRMVCKKCGWVGRFALEMTNRRIDELDEQVLEDILSSLSEDPKDK